mgnify:CR=1 FL=1
MPTVTVSEKGQVVIPAAIRKGLGIKPGTELDFELDGASIRVSLRQSVPASSIASGYGMLRASPAQAPRKLSGFDAAQALRRAPRK